MQPKIIRMPRLTAELAPVTHDIDPIETQEWLESYDALVEQHGVERAHFILTTLLKRAQIGQVKLPALIQTPYINTIRPEDEPHYPGDERMELRIRRYIRWNAVAMVVRGNLNFPGIGGHLSTYASAATLFEVGFNHFFRGNSLDRGGDAGDQIFLQGHASPGVYARAYLEGRLTESQLEHFRREVVPGAGLSSYPHPRLMPDFWQFPTVSMGLGPHAAIYQARFNRYLLHRNICDTSKSRVWAFVGDGETDEPETLGALHLASRERLSNLTFVVNCNLQRLDGPVRGNGKIIQELEAVFKGAGWNVIKVIWGRNWDPLLAKDTSGILVRRMGEVVDGEYQKLSAESGSYIRQHFFGTDPRLLDMVSQLSDDELRRLRRGGHDFRKVYAAYRAACEEQEKPTVILAKTVKGWTLGASTQARNTTHQQKKLTLEELATFRNTLELDIADEDLANPPFLKFEAHSHEHEYLLERRAALGGFVPRRRAYSMPLNVPEIDWFDRYLQSTGEQDLSTTAAFARILAMLLGHKELGRRIVPIIPDEARTFGLEALFRKHGIYSSLGQLYEPIDAHLMLSYREARDGQVLEEGICEAGSVSSFLAAGSAYASFGQPMIPFYIFYSMFGFQRTGDQIWAAGDQRCRGFLLGATAGRTTLNGEGLQHQDGHSHLLASSQPHITAYDPSFAYEIAVIIQDGLYRMCQKEEDIIYYLTLQNVGYRMPAMPEGSRQGILDGIYFLKAAPSEHPRKAQLLGSGSIMLEVLRAQELLAERYQVAADVWSVTSYSNLRRQALACERRAMLHPEQTADEPIVSRVLNGTRGPIVAASDYMKAIPDQIARWVPRLYALGTDGFGRSDTRKSLRSFFEVDAEHITVATLSRLAAQGELDRGIVAQAIRDFSIDPEKADPAFS